MKIENEQEAWRTVDAMTEGLRERVVEQTKLIEQNQKIISEKDELIAELLRKLESK